jgi:hypothetical protein
MAKKFVRGVTGVDDIESFDKSLTNVNDLISDGQNTYVHTKKGKNEFYYKVTDGVTSVKSTNSTINVEKSDDGALKLDTNPQKVLEHDNLLTNYGISKTTSGNTTKLGIEYTRVPDGFDLNGLQNGRVRAVKLLNAPSSNTGYFVSAYSEGDYTIQDAITLKDNTNTTFRRIKSSGVWGSWSQQVGDKSVIDGLLANKQDALNSSLSIGVSLGKWLRQLYINNQTYNTANGMMKTHVKSIANNVSVETAEEEFNFIVKINKGASSVNFTLNTNDTTKFSNIMRAYGSNNTVNINDCVFTLSGSTLSVSTTNNTAQNYVITFSDII